jgi:hypothetical protein
MRALEIDVVALTEILVPRGHRAEMGMIDAPAIHYNLKGSGRISINRGPNMQLMPRLLIVVPPNTPFSIEVDGGDGATRLINRDCWKRDEEGRLRVAVPNEKPEVVQFAASSTRPSVSRLVCFATCANQSSSNSNRRTRLMASSARP